MPFYLQSKNRMGIFSRELREGRSNEKKKITRKPPDGLPIPSLASVFLLLSCAAVLLFCSFVFLPYLPFFLTLCLDQNPRKMFNAQGLDAKWEGEGLRSWDPSLPISLFMSCRVKQVQVSIPMDPSWVESPGTTRNPWGVKADPDSVA